MRLSSRRLVSALCIAGAPLAASGCGTGDDLELIGDGGSAISGLPMPDIDTPIAAGLATTFCVPDGTGPVSVAPYLPTQGFEVSDFRVVDVDGPMATPTSPARLLGMLAPRPASSADQTLREALDALSRVLTFTRRASGGARWPACAARPRTG